MLTKQEAQMYAEMVHASASNRAMNDFILKRTATERTNKANAQKALTLGIGTIEAWQAANSAMRRAELCAYADFCALPTS